MEISCTKDCSRPTKLSNQLSKIMQYYDDIPVKNTDSKRQPIKFRDTEKIIKKKERSNAQKRLTKRKWLDYNSPRDTNYDD